MSRNNPEEFWHVDKQNFDCFRKDRIRTTKTKCGGIIMYIPKKLKPRLCDDLKCFQDTSFESLWVDLSIQKKEMRFEFIILSRKKLVKMFLEKLVVGIDLAMAEGKTVILAGDYNLNYFSKRDKSLLQSAISPYDLKPTNIYTATRMTNSSSTLIDYIITDD